MQSPVIADDVLQWMAFRAANGGMRMRRREEGFSARAELDDMVQEGRIAAWLAQTRYRADGGASLKTFAWTRAHGAMLDWRRAQALFPTVVAAMRTAEHGPGAAPPASEALERAQACAMVRAALRQISAAHRRVLVSYFFAGEKIAVMAAREGVNEPAMRQRVRAGVRAMRLLLAQGGMQRQTQK